MKKLLTLSLTLALLLGVSSALADSAVQDTIDKDFSYGQNSQGCYYYNENQELAYSQDASLIGEQSKCKSLGSSQWYVLRSKAMKQRQTDAYYNRIRAMLILSAK